MKNEGVMRPLKDGSGYSICYCLEKNVGKGRCNHILEGTVMTNKKILPTKNNLIKRLKLASVVFGSAILLAACNNSNKLPTIEPTIEISSEITLTTTQSTTEKLPLAEDNITSSNLSTEKLPLATDDITIPNLPTVDITETNPATETLPITSLYPSDVSINTNENNEIESIVITNESSQIFIDIADSITVTTTTADGNTSTESGKITDITTEYVEITSESDIYLIPTEELNETTTILGNPIKPVENTTVIIETETLEIPTEEETTTQAEETWGEWTYDEWDSPSWDWSIWTVKTPATQTDEGIEERIGTRTLTRTMSRTSSYGNVETNSETKIETKSETRTIAKLAKDEVWGEWKEDSKKSTPKAWSEWIITRDATFTSEGTKTRSRVITYTITEKRTSNLGKTETRTQTSTETETDTQSIPIKVEIWGNWSNPEWKFGNWAVTKAATYDDTGLEERVGTRTLTRTSNAGRIEHKVETTTESRIIAKLADISGDWKETSRTNPSWTWSNWKTIKSATYTEEGKEERTGKRDVVVNYTKQYTSGKIETKSVTLTETTTENRSIPKLIETWSEWKEDGKSYSEWTWNDWKVIISPTYTNNGKEERTGIRTVKITYSRTSSAGKTETKYDNTSETKVESRIIDKLVDGWSNWSEKSRTPGSWTWGNWKQTKAPTYEETGSEERVGTREIVITFSRTSSSGKTETKTSTENESKTESRAIPKLVDSWTDWKEYTRTYGDIKWGNWTVKTPATYTSGGVEERTGTRSITITYRRTSASGKTEEMVKTEQETKSETRNTAKLVDTWGTWTYGSWTNPEWTWGEWKQTKAPTYTADGVETRTGTRTIERTKTRTSASGKVETDTETKNETTTETRVVIKLSDSWGEWVVGSWNNPSWTWGNWTVKTPATYTSAGVEERVGTRTLIRTKTRTSASGKTETETETKNETKTETRSIAKLVETWGSWTYSAWSWTDWTQTKAPTHTSTGTEERTGTRTKTRTSNAGNTQSEQETKVETRDIPKLVDTWGTWVEGPWDDPDWTWSGWTQTKAPTYTANGVEERTGTRTLTRTLTRTSASGKTESKNESKTITTTQQRDIPKLVDNWSDWVETSRTNPDWTWGSWTTVKSATCTAVGKKTRTGTRAVVITYTRTSTSGKTETKTTTENLSKTEEQEIPKLAHSYVDTVVAPTYTAQGYTIHRCSACGHEYKDSYTAKLEDKIVDTKASEVVITSPTCTEPGSKKITTTTTWASGKVETSDKTESIPALGHDWHTHTIPAGVQSIQVTVGNVKHLASGRIFSPADWITPDMEEYDFYKDTNLSTILAKVYNSKAEAIRAIATSAQLQCLYYTTLSWTTSGNLGSTTHTVQIMMPETTETICNRCQQKK